MKRYCLTLDLKDDPELIAEYEFWHKAENGWPEITKNMLDTGIVEMEIYRSGNRLMMIMETNDEFDLQKKATMDAQNPKVQEWENMMLRFQVPVAWAKPGEKWVVMNKIFNLNILSNENISV